MSKEIRLNAFAMNCVGHQSQGLWRHPRDRSSEYNTLRHWTELARILERGKFDGLFLADVLGVYDVYGGSVETALRNSVQVPVNDPLLIIPAMAQATEHLGFGVTCTLSYEPPYPFARRMSTLDHLTQGRIGWNIVTGYLQSAAKGSGLDAQAGHDTRYAMADDYMEVVYRLWEGSWADDAVLRDRAGGIFTNPDKVRRVRHDGPYFQVDAIHLCEPSPQRTPVLYQAGASEKGVEFAARHAECVFVGGPAKPIVARSTSKIRKRAAELGRDPSDILAFALMAVIVAPTDREAQEKLEDYRRYVSHAAALSLVSGWTGIDFSQYRLDQKIERIRSDAIHSVVDALAPKDPGKAWTVGEIAEYIGVGGLGPLIVGSPERVCDELEGWIEDTGIDGFNLAYMLMPETFADFVDLVVPELQRRGRYKQEYRPGTYREKLFGRGPRLAPPHPAASYRPTAAVPAGTAQGAGEPA